MKQYTLTFLLSIVASLSFLCLGNLKASLLLASIGLITWRLTHYLIPKIVGFMLKSEIFGYDINKKGSEAGEKKIPECIGFAAAVSFLMVGSVVSLIIKYYKNELQLIHLAALVVIIGTILLGFADDMLDLPWRYKLIFPFFIFLPILAAYDGSTSIYVPFPFSLITGHSLQLGILFLIYITLLGIYCTNTINIYAGINGLEVGQSIVAASFFLICFSVNILKGQPFQKYVYSSYLLISFLGGSIALMKLNAYPSQIFIGDTYCYFAGIIIAISALMSGTSIVCHMFLIPQLINFLYSTPQLFGFVPCPRHRLTTYNKEKDTLHPKDENMNLLNLSLRIIGPTNEGKLCSKLLIFQILTSSIPVLIRLFS